MALTINEMNEKWDQQQATPTNKMFRLLSIKDLEEELPPPSWLIDGIIEDNVLGVLYGASGDGKSFVGIDWSLCVASGQGWHGRRVNTGHVVYVVAEGSRGIKKRIDAWTQERQVSPPTDMFVILDAVQFTEREHVRGLLAQIAERGITPRLIVIDTLARCFLGGDENSSKEMGQFIAACSEVKQSTRATVLAVHHTGKQRGRKPSTERGSNALRGAADVMIRVSKKDNIITLDVDKQKDDEAVTGIRLRLKTVVVGEDPATGKGITSCVLIAAGDAAPVRPRLGVGPMKTLRTLTELPDATAHSTEWREAVPPEHGEPIKVRTFQNHREDLIEQGLVTPVDGREKWYQATEQGIAIAKGMPFERQRQLPSVSAANATPPIGVAGGTGEAQSSSVPSEDGGTAADEMSAVVEDEGGDAGR